MKKAQSYLIAAAIFIILPVIFFSPLFSGKELRQSDVNNWKGMAQEIVSYKEKTGEQTLWTNSMFGGMPAYQISVVYHGNLLQYLDEVISLGLPKPASYLFLLMAGFYFLLLTLGVDKRISIVGAVGYAFSSYFLLFIAVGHNSKAHAIAFIAPFIAGVLMTYRGRALLGACIAGLALGLQLYANHLQITYYMLLMTILLVIVMCYTSVKEKRIADFLKGSLLLAVVAMLAVAANITNIMATQEYGKYSTRGPSELSTDKENKTSGLDRDYITDWSYGIGETMTLLIPNFKGGASEPISMHSKEALNNVDPNMKQYVGGFSSYFGPQYGGTSGPAYAGAIIVLLFVLGLFIVKGPIKWWIVSATVLSLLLSWGRNFMSFTNFFLDYIPGYDKFRAVTTILVIALFTLPLLATLAVDQLYKQTDIFQKHRKKLLIGLSIVVGISFLIMIAPGIFTEFYNEHEYGQVQEQLKGQQGSAQMLDDFFSAVSQARKEIVTADAMRSFFLVLFASVLVFTYTRYRYNLNYFVYGLLLLIILDMALLDQRFFGKDRYVRKSESVVPFPMTVADQAILKDTSEYRVLNLAVNTFNDASTSYYHHSIGGYHGAKLKRYKELIDYRLVKEITDMTTHLRTQDSSLTTAMTGQSSMNMLNAKYIIFNPDAEPFLNRGALGNAWFVKEIKWVANADSEIAALDYFNPAETAIVDQRFKTNITENNFEKDSASTIQLISYKPDHLVYHSSSSKKECAVFSEIYYDKGWNAYVDGKQTEYFRCNYVLRGMLVPSGEHQIEFKFEPTVYSTGEKISYAGSALLLAFAGVVLVLERRKK